MTSKKNSLFEALWLLSILYLGRRSLFKDIEIVFVADAMITAHLLVVELTSDTLR